MTFASNQKYALIEFSKVDAKPALVRATQICGYPTRHDLLIKVGIGPLYSDRASCCARPNKSPTEKPVYVELKATFELGA